MNLIIENTKNTATIEHGKGRIRRIRSNAWVSDFKSSYLKAERHRKETLDAIPINICITSRFDEEKFINENGELLQAFKDDPDELCGSMQYHSSFIGITMIVDQKMIFMCEQAMERMRNKGAHSFRLWIGFETDLRWKSRNSDFNFSNFLNGQHYFIEDLTFQEI